jgi:hypothetical protein
MMFRAYVKNLVSAGIWEKFAIASVVFMLNALIVAGGMEYFFPHLKNDYSFISIFSPVEFIASVLFLNNHRAAEDGYTDPLRVLAEYKKKVSRIPMNSDIDKLPKIYPAIQALVDQANKLRGIPLPNSYLDFKLHTRLNPKLEARLAAMSFGAAGRTLVSQIKFDLGKDKEGNLCVDEVYTFIQNWEISQLISEPPFAFTQNQIFLFAWFFVWLPITIWARSSVRTTFLVYPFIAHILWATSILRHWLGSPWAHDRPFRESEHEDWTFAFKTLIRQTCQDRWLLKYEDASQVF